MENKNIIIILVAIIIVLAAVLGVMLLQTANAKEPTKVKITNNKTLTEGDSLSFQLTDLNKTPLSKEKLNVKIANSKGKLIVNKTVKTNSKGKAKLDWDLKKGKYTVNVTYKGNENYTGNNTTQKLTIKEKAKTTTAESSSSSSSSNQFEGSTWQKRTHWDDGTPVNKELYLITTPDGDYWTYEDGNYYHGVDRFI